MSDKNQTPSNETVTQKIIRRYNATRASVTSLMAALQALDSALVDLGQTLQDFQTEYEMLKMENNRLTEEKKQVKKT
jgi:chromosome segregation ATPase